MHDVILNGACLACGEREFPERVEDAWKQQQDMVPLANLTRSRDDDDS